MKAVPRTMWLFIAVVLLIGLFAAVAYAAPAGQTAKPPPPAADLKIVAVTSNVNDPNAITGTITFMTSTKTGNAKAVVGGGATGLTTVPVSVPVHLVVSPVDPTQKVMTVTWSLIAPSASKAKLVQNSKMTTMTAFSPDVPGAYMVNVTLGNTNGTGDVASTTLHAATFVGETAGNCKQCHAAKVDAWSKTGHSRIESDLIDNKRTPNVPTHYAETCLPCHTTGYYPGRPAGGYTDAEAKAKYTLPTFEKIDAAGKGGPSNWAAMPADVKNMANVQCENCHGPAGLHVTKGTPMVSSMDNGVCDQCHDASYRHMKGTDIQYSAHSNAADMAWTEPVGPGEQNCVRCHSGAGYTTFIANPKDPAEWDNSQQTVGCSTCHDPHSAANPWQLRIVGKPIQLPFDAKDAGLSATCEECHNSRVQPANAVKGSYPHYSSAADLLNDVAGVTYGQTLPNSPHGMMVGVAPIPNPEAASDPEAGKFLFSKAEDKTGQKPGPCVACHMYPTIADLKDPNSHKVGSHSFNATNEATGFDYTAPCKTCHATIGDTFNIKAKADYDGNGKVEGVQDEVAGLLSVLWKGLEANGVTKLDSGYPYATLPKNASDKIKNAWYNYRTVYGLMWGEDDPGNQGKASAIHNFARSVALLQASYKDLTGKDVPGATLIK